MREIKFRLYSHYYKSMFLFDPRWGNYSPGDGWVGAIPFEDERVRYAPSNRQQLEPESCEWMQYTGLKDQGGVEIYGGDIVKESGSYQSGTYYWETIYKVEQDAPNGGFNLRGIDNEGDYVEIDYKEDTLKVIGNIHSNPELLEVK